MNKLFFFRIYYFCSKIFFKIGLQSGKLLDFIELNETQFKVLKAIQSQILNNDFNYIDYNVLIRFFQLELDQQHKILNDNSILKLNIPSNVVFDFVRALSAI